MDLIYIGKLVNTHGLKGEVKIISDFKYKDQVFKENNSIYINNTIYKIKSYRHHKIFDMLVLDGVNFDAAINLKGSEVYIERSDYNFNGYITADLIGLSVYDGDIYKGKVVDILKTINYELLVIDGIKKHFIPSISEFVKEVDLKNKIIKVDYIKGLDYED